MENKISKAKRVRGVVVSDKMQKTRVVEVSHYKMHPQYLKQYVRSRRLKAHDENNQYQNGVKVIIEESRPLSKDKKWVIIGKI